jgi:hypothetical protein
MPLQQTNTVQPTAEWCRYIGDRPHHVMASLAAGRKSTGGYGYGSSADADTIRWLFRQRAAGVKLRVLAGLTPSDLRRWGSTPPLQCPSPAPHSPVNRLAPGAKVPSDRRTEVSGARRAPVRGDV